MAQARAQERDTADAGTPQVMQTMTGAPPPEEAQLERRGSAAATAEQSSAPASMEDDVQLVHEGVEASARAAPVLHALTTEQIAQEMSPEEQAFWADSPPEAPALMGESQAMALMLAALPAAERDRFQTACVLAKIDPFDACLALLQVVAYRPEVWQKAKALIFGGSGAVRAGGRSAVAARASAPLCGTCQEPIAGARDGQRYHAGRCGQVAAGRLPAEDQPQLAQFTDEHYTVPQDQPRLTPLDLPEGWCGLCTLPIEDGHQGQRFHAGRCGALATGRVVPGTAPFVRQVQEYRRDYLARQQAGS